MKFFKYFNKLFVIVLVLFILGLITYGILFLTNSKTDDELYLIKEQHQLIQKNQVEFVGIRKANGLPVFVMYQPSVDYIDESYAFIVYGNIPEFMCEKLKGEKINKSALSDEYIMCAVDLNEYSK